MEVMSSHEHSLKGQSRGERRRQQQRASVPGKKRQEISGPRQCSEKPPTHRDGDTALPETTTRPHPPRARNVIRAKLDPPTHPERARTSQAPRPRVDGETGEPPPPPRGDGDPLAKRPPRRRSAGRPGRDPAPRVGRAASPGAFRVVGSGSARDGGDGAPSPPRGGGADGAEAPTVSAVLVPPAEEEVVAVATPLRLPGKVKVIIAVLLLAVVGLAVGLFFGTRDGPGAGMSDSSQDPPHGEEQEPERPKRAFARSSSYVRSVCSAQSLGTTLGSRRCEEACSEASCCDPHDPAPCLDGDNLGSCVAHCRCHALDDDVVGPAPDGLPLLCSPERLAAGDRAACEAACAPAGCCFADAEYDRCQARNFLRCLDYAPCQNLRASTELAPAPPDLDEICADEEEGGDGAKCRDICSAAACCLPGFAGDSCLHNDLVSCFTYASCGGMDLPPICKTVPCAPENINEICSLDRVFEPSESRDRCTEECSSASCCGALDSSNCFLQDPFACAEYAICGLLLVTGGTVPRAPPDLGHICSVETLRPQGGGRDCALACEKALCCITLPEYNCLDDGNLLACAEYALPCANLLYEGGNLPDPPDNITVICSGSNVQTREGCRDCKELCWMAACCVSQGDDNCLVGNQETCAEWVLGPCSAHASC